MKNFLKRNKLTPTFDPQPYIVTRKKGTRLTVKNIETGIEYDRHINHAKRITCGSPFVNLEQPALVFDEMVNPEETNSAENPHQEDDGASVESSSHGPVRVRRNRNVRRPDYLNDYLLHQCNRIA